MGTQGNELQAEFEAIIHDLPHQFAPFLSPLPSPSDRAFRQSLFTVFSDGQHAKLAAVPELLTLAAALTPPFFRPTPPSVSDMAVARAKAYTAQVLTTKADAIWRTQSLPTGTENTIDRLIQQFWVGNVERLELNFNQREHISNYLRDVKGRAGILASLTCLLAAASESLPNEVLDLAVEIGETLGAANAILSGVTATLNRQNFTEQLMTGHYELPLLFAFEEEADYFQTFFAQPKKPSEDQLITVQALTIQSGKQPAVDMAIELINQAGLDCKMLPAGTTRDHLSEYLATQKQVANEL